MRFARISVPILAFGLCVHALAKDKVSLGEAADQAIQQSKLTLAGSKPFHLKADIVETTNPSSEYQAKIEEYWVSPQKWRRTVEALNFSQTLIVNGDQISEKDTGDYFPWWLSDLLTAMTDPLPMVEQLRHINAELAKPQGSGNSSTCSDIRTEVDRWIFCFESSHGLLISAFARGYSVEFKDFKNFAGKRIARLLVIDPEPGTTIQARITELTEFRQGDEAPFAVQKATPPQEQIKTVQVDEATLRGLALGSTEITWPSVGGGPTKGRCAVYVSADRTGRMREVWPQGCDNPGLQDPLREMVKKWRLKPAVQNGAPVQIEALVTFTFETAVENDHPLPKTSDAKVPRSATNVAKPKSQYRDPMVVRPDEVECKKPDCGIGQGCYGIHGTVNLLVNVLADGTVDVAAATGDKRLFDDAIKATKQCRFHPGTDFILTYKF